MGICGGWILGPRFNHTKSTTSHLYQPPTSSRLGVTSLYLGVITCRILPINYTILFIHRAATDIFQLAFLILQRWFIKSWTFLPGLYHYKRTAAVFQENKLMRVIWWSWRKVMFYSWVLLGQVLFVSFI